MNRPASTNQSRENPRELECQEATRGSRAEREIRGERSNLEEFRRSPPHQSAIGDWEERVIVREDPPLKVTVATVVAERQASAGARDGVKGRGANSLRALRCMR